MGRIMQNQENIPTLYGTETLASISDREFYRTARG